MLIHPERIELIQFCVPAGMWPMPFSCCRFGWTVPTQPVAITPSMTVRLFKRIISIPASASGMLLRHSGLGQDTLVLSAGRSSQRPLEVVSSPALPLLPAFVFQPGALVHLPQPAFALSNVCVFNYSLLRFLNPCMNLYSFKVRYFAPWGVTRRQAPRVPRLHLWTVGEHSQWSRRRAWCSLCPWLTPSSCTSSWDGGVIL